MAIVVRERRGIEPANDIWDIDVLGDPTSGLAAGVGSRATRFDAGYIGDQYRKSGVGDSDWTLILDASASALVGMVDPTDYGYVTTDTDIQPSSVADSWAALQAACFACYNDEGSGTATGGTATSLLDATATFAATLDDRIDAGAGLDFSHEVVFLSGNNKGRHSNIDVVVSGTELTLSPALPNAVAVGDQYRILKSSRTQTRRANKILRLPPGRAKIMDEVTAIRGTSAFCVQGSGMGVTMLDFSLATNTLAPTTFNSATATTLTKTGAGWSVDQFKGRFCWTWSNSAPRAVTAVGRIVSNTADTLTVTRWGGSTPTAASETFAIGLRSNLFLNGIGGASFSEFQVYAGAASDAGNQNLMKIAVQWMRPTATLPGDEDRCAFSSSQNTFFHVEASGRSVQNSMRYGNYLFAGNNQVDNGLFIGCRFTDAWEPGTSTDQRYSKSPVYLGDGTAGNALINTMIGGAVFYGQNGISIGWQDVITIGTTFQSNGDTSLQNEGGRGLGDIYIQGVSSFASFQGCRSEGSSAFITTGPASSIHQQIEISQCEFHIGGNTIFALNGYVVDVELYSALRLAGLWIYGDDPMAYATPRRAACRHLLGVVRCESVGCVGSDVYEFFPSGLSAPIQVDYYAELNTGNGIVKTWVGGVKLHSTSTPAAAGDQWRWEGVAGTAPDVSHGRSAAGVYTFNQNLSIGGQVYSDRHDAGNSGTALTIDWNNANVQKVTLTGNCTFTFSNPASGAVYDLELVQDATGSRTVTWPGTVRWPGGTTPTLTTTASRRDRFTFRYNGSTYDGNTVGLNYT